MDQRLLRKVRRRDRVARWFITGGGVLIIVAVIGILFLIASVAAPLFFPPSVTQRAAFALPTPPAAGPVLAAGTDEYLESAYTFTADGTFTFFALPAGRELERVRVASPGDARARAAAVQVSGHLRHSITWSDGSVSVDEVRFAPVFDKQGTRTISRKVVRLGALPAPAGAPKPLLATAVFSEERGLTGVAALGDTRLTVTQVISKEDLFGNKTEETQSFELEDALPGAVRALVLNAEGTRLFAGTANGYLAAWDLSEPGEAGLLAIQRAFGDRRAVTALAVFPGGSAIVGDAKGGLSTWFPVRTTDGERNSKLVMNHELEPRAAAVTQIVPALLTRSVVTVDAAGAGYLDYVTGERALPRLKAQHPLRVVGASVRFNAVAGVDDQGRFNVWELDIPHPEAGWQTYFGKIWYGSFTEPAYVWQSSSGEDDFEPKLSLVPLIFGTLKGTFYGMLFAVPLALLGAMYTSHLMQPRLRRVVKPAVEIMGSMPSVVIGFLAALWLAPIIKVSLLAIFLILALLPLAVLLTVMAWERAGERFAVMRLARGYEFLVLAPALVLLVFLCFQVGALLEHALFGGNLTLWLYQHLGVEFDQRNSVVIAFALGFAVIPTIFTLADDALSNVPRNLTAASLALGASRWQTVWRVVLPSASPGIFAALMIGLGRAVGETMIVLMATGNTPIMSWSPFNGMRTLSANIAVEIPEAPFNGTLYRTLFLSAVLLFLFTFVLNSAAELVRQWLRGKYGRY